MNLSFVSILKSTSLDSISKTLRSVREILSHFEIKIGFEFTGYLVLIRLIILSLYGGTVFGNPSTLSSEGPLLKYCPRRPIRRVDVMLFCKWSDVEINMKV